MLIDSHVNLHAPQFADDQGAVIDRARSAGVAILTPEAWLKNALPPG